MNINSCFELGHVIKVHGVKGEVLVFLDADQPERYEDLGSLFLEIDGKLVPYFIRKIKLQGNDAIVSFEDVQGIEQARKLVSCRLFLPLKFLPDLGDRQFYLHEIVGYRVIDEKAGQLGKIKSIYDANGNRLIGVDYKGKEILIPLNDDFIIRTDKVNKELLMNLPEGLLDI